MIWRLGRLRTLLGGAWRHLHREGLRKTLDKALHRLHEHARARPSAATVDMKHTHDVRPRILIVDATMPDPSRDSGSLRLCNLMRILSDMGWNIVFMPDNLKATNDEKAMLEALGVQTLCRPETSSLANWLNHGGEQLEAVMLCRHYVAAAHVGLIRRHAPSARLLFDTVDLHHLREMRAAEYTQTDRKTLRSIQRTKRQELNLVRKCDVTFVVSPIEKQLLEQEVSGSRIRLLSNIHRLQPNAPGAHNRRDLIFVGGWGHPPNRDAITWLVHDIMPKLVHRLPEIRLHLVGDLPAEARVSLNHPNVYIHGRVPDLSLMMRECRVALAPLRYGAGVKGKINTAMSHAVPVVATSMAIEGMFLTPDKDVLVADTAEAFVEQIVRVYQNEALWMTLSRAGLENIRRHFSFEAARCSLESELDAPSTHHVCEINNANPGANAKPSREYR